MNKKSIIYIAPLPPPHMGPSIATQIILNSRYVNEFHVVHIDTGDRRPLNNIGRLDVINVFLALKHYFLLFIKLLSIRAALVYVPISQQALGFLRDVPFIFISKFFRKKVLLHLRGGNFREFYVSSDIIMKFLIEKTLKKVDGMIVLGHSLKPLFYGLIPEKKLLVVPNGLDISFNGHRKNVSSPKQFTILFLSNFIASKGYWDVLNSIKKVVEFQKNVRFLFAGSWLDIRDRLRCREFIQRQGLADYVEFMPAVKGEEKIKLLMVADVFVFPTYYPFEGHPWVIVEAMAAALPIITTNQGCIKETVIDGKNGFIIPKKDPDAIAEKIICFITHPELRETMGNMSRKLYEENFTEKHFVQRMIDATYCILQ